MANVGARYTKVTSRKWNDPFYLGLSPQQRNLFDYLVENGDVTGAGVYQCDFSVARMKTQPWRRGRFEETLDAFAGHVQFYEDSWTFVVQYLRHNGENMNPNFALGIVAVVENAPLQVQADFWSVYAKSDRLNRFGVPEESSLKGLPKPLLTPGLTSPGRTRPYPTNKPPSKISGRKLTDAQNEFKEARIAYWQQCLNTYYDAPDGENVEFRDAKHAVGLFSKLAKRGSYEGTRTDRAIRLFFKRRSDWREQKRSETPANEVAPPVPVGMKDFDRQFQEFYDLAGRP